MQCFCRFQTHGSPKNVPDPLRIPSGSPPDPHRIPRSGHLLKAPPKPGSREQNTEFGRDPRRDPPRPCPLVPAGAISQIVPSYLTVCNRQLGNVGTIWAEGFCAPNASGLVSAHFRTPLGSRALPPSPPAPPPITYPAPLRPASPHRQRTHRPKHVFCFLRSFFQRATAEGAPRPLMGPATARDHRCCRTETATV